MVYILRGFFLKDAWLFSDCISSRQRLNSNIIPLLIYSFTFPTKLFQALLNARHSAGNISIKKAKSLPRGIENLSFLISLIYAIPWKWSRIFFPSSFLPSLSTFFLSFILLSFFLFLLHSFLCYSTNISSSQSVWHYPRHWVTCSIKSSPSFWGALGSGGYYKYISDQMASIIICQIIIIKVSRELY